MADVLGSIALDEVVAAAQRIVGRPNPDAQNLYVRQLEEGDITTHQFCVRVAALHLAMLAWAEDVERVPAGED